jgi:hypothetical protein
MPEGLGNAVIVEIGSLPILLRSDDALFCEMLEQRYRGFTSPRSRPNFELEISLREAALEADADAEVEVRMRNGRWVLTRGDFVAEWQVSAGRGRVLQSRNPYSIDSVLRILHTLILARDGGFLIHAASVIREGRAFLFAGVSGAGKTTISRLAPEGVTLLSDEISYIRRESGEYRACGTPFAGELGQPGENVSAPIAGLFLLQKGQANFIEPMDQAEAVRSLLRNILFFAGDEELVKLVFQSACDFANTVPVRRLTFMPDQRVWELIRRAPGRMT